MGKLVENRSKLILKLETRTLSFWSMLVTGKQSKLSFIMYCLVKLDENNIYTSEWIRFIRNTLNECGLSYIWSQQDSVNPEWLKKRVNQILNDQYYQKWLADIHQSPKCLFTKQQKNQ